MNLKRPYKTHRIPYTTIDIITTKFGPFLLYFPLQFTYVYVFTQKQKDKHTFVFPNLYGKKDINLQLKTRTKRITRYKKLKIVKLKQKKKIKRAQRGINQ